MDISMMVVAVLVASIATAGAYFAHQAARAARDSRESLRAMEAPEPPTAYAVHLLGDTVTLLGAQHLRSMAVDLVHSGGYEIVLTDRRSTDESGDAPDEMRWRAEVWYAHRGVLLAYKAAMDVKESVPSEVPGIVGVPLWLNDGPTPGSVTQLAAEWIVQHPVGRSRWVFP